MKRLILLLAVLCLLACVPTPETEAVIVKDGTAKANEPTLPLADPLAECLMTYAEGDVTVRFDAVPDTPEIERIASYALHAAGFTDQQLAGFVHAFFGDDPVYEPGEPTKEELYPQLLAALERYEQVKANPGAYEAGADAYRADAEELQQAYNAAQDADQLIPKAVAFARNETSGAFGCRGDGGRSTMATLVVFSEGVEAQSLMRYQNPSRYVPESYAKSVSPGLTLNMSSVDRAEAIRIASDLAQALCGDTLRSSEVIQKQRVLPHFQQRFNAQICADKCIYGNDFRHFLSPVRTKYRNNQFLQRLKARRIPINSAKQDRIVLTSLRAVVLQAQLAPFIPQRMIHKIAAVIRLLYRCFSHFAASFQALGIVIQNTNGFQHLGIQKVGWIVDILCPFIGGAPFHEIPRGQIFQQSIRIFILLIEMQQIIDTFLEKLLFVLIATLLKVLRNL